MCRRRVEPAGGEGRQAGPRTCASLHSTCEHKGQDDPLFTKGKKASSSIGRAAVSKTAGWGFDSLLACHQTDD
jgi:hypothetical protein